MASSNDNQKDRDSKHIKEIAKKTGDKGLLKEQQKREQGKPVKK